MRKPKPDRVDAELVEELVVSPGWALVRQRMLAIRTNHAAALVGDRTESETATLRGQVRGIDQALMVPELIIREGRKKKGDD